jgi:hypothetical protein
VDRSVRSERKLEKARKRYNGEKSEIGERETLER